MKENTIVTLADSNYFELLKELIDSINYHKESKNIYWETRSSIGSPIYR